MSRKMRAVRLFAPGDVRCVDVDVPQIEKGDDVILKVKACGVCGSDIPRVMVKGAYHYPITIGHEFSGEIVDMGNDVQGFEMGERVSVMPLLNCGKCKYCRIGEAVTCDDYDYYGSRTDGAMAEYVRVRYQNMLHLPSGVDFEMGAMTDPVSVGLHAVRKCNVIPGYTAVVFGLGAIGYLAMQWFKNSGCEKVIVVDIFDEKLRLAERLGADYALNGAKVDVKQTVMELTGGQGADCVVELAGSKITQVQSLEVVRKHGVITFCGISYDDLVIPNAMLQKLLRAELTVKGAWNSSIAPLPINEWETALDFMQNGRIKCNPLITHRYRLEECQRAFDMMYNKTDLFTKVLFKPED